MGLRGFILLALLSSAALAFGQGQGSWRQVADMPTSRQEVGVTQLDGQVYVASGITSGAANSVVERYTPATDTWESATIADLPAPVQLHHVSLAATGGYVYAIGGFHSGFTAIDAVFRYDPTLNSWTQMASLPNPRGAIGVAAIDGIIYAAGGRPGQTEFTAYHPASDEWTTLTPMPTGRDHMAIAVHDGKFYSISGRQVAIANVLDVVEVYDPVTAQWASSEPVPTPRGGIAAGVVDDRIYVFGGEGNPASPQGVFDIVEEYDTQTGLWREVAPMTLPRHGIGVAVVSGEIYIPGGAPIEGLSDTPRTDVYTPPAPVPAELSGMWLR